MITPSVSSPPIDSGSALSVSERKLFSTYSQCSDDSDTEPLPNRSRFLCGSTNFSSLKEQLKKRISSNDSERGPIQPSPTSDALADHLADGMVLLSNRFCPLCNANLLKSPIDGSPPFCSRCTGVATDNDSNSVIDSWPPGSTSIGDNLNIIPFDVEEEVENRLKDANIDYTVGRESASKIIGSKMIEGFTLQDISCDKCSMPLMKKENNPDDNDDGSNDAIKTSSHSVECVVCPYILNVKRKELRKDVEVEAKRIEEENKLLENRISLEKSRIDKERKVVFEQMSQIKADAEKSKNDAEEARKELAVAQEKRILAEEETARQTEQMKNTMNQKLAEMMQEEVKVYENKFKHMKMMEEKKNLNDTKVANELKEMRKVKIRMTEIEWNRLEELLGMEETRLREELKIIRDSSKRGEAVQKRRILAIELKGKEEKEFVYAEKAKLEVEVQASVAARNVAMNKLDEAERQLRITEEKAGKSLIALEGSQDNFGAPVESVEMQVNLKMATEYAEHERLASAKFLMLSRAYTEACQKSEKELKELSVIERECAHKIELLDLRLTKSAAEVVNVKLDGEEEDLAASLIKITRKRETESKQYAHFLSVVQSNPENIEDVVEEEINRLQRILISLSDTSHEFIVEPNPDIANEQEEKLFFYNQSIRERDLQWRNMKNDGPGRMKKFMMNGWALNNERCAGIMCNNNPLLQLKEERSCSICRGDGSGESGIYLKVKKYDAKRVLVSREIGERMLSGWKLLDEQCIKCTMPLMLKPLLLGNSKSEGKEEQGAPISACSTNLSSIRVCIECGPNKEDILKKKEDILMAQRRKEVLTIAESEAKVAAAEKAKQEAEKKAERSTVEMEEQARKLIEKAEQQLNLEKRKAVAAEEAMYEAENALHEAELLADSRAIDDRIRVMAEIREEKAYQRSSQARRESKYRVVDRTATMREDKVSSKDYRREGTATMREDKVSSRDSRRFRGEDNVMKERIMLNEEEESHVDSVTVTIPDDFDPNDKNDIESLMNRITGSRNRKTQNNSEPIGMNIGVTADNEQDSLSNASHSGTRSSNGMSPFHVRPVPGMTRSAVASDNSRMNSRGSPVPFVRGGSHDILPQSHRDLNFTNDKRAISRSAHTLTKWRNNSNNNHLSSSKKSSISHSVRPTCDIRNEGNESSNIINSNFDMIMSQIEATKDRLIDAKDQNNVGEQIEMASLLEKLATTAAAIKNIE